ncbi:MAG: glycoside hydrolase family 2, partial [Oscillospiraceae bacterium]
MVENKHKNDAALTYWGENLNIESPLPEYPRPQLWRQSFFSLNGVWSYAVRNAFSGLPDYYDGEIVVPYTPECVLSGIYESIAVSRAFWYRKYIVLPKNFNPENKVILNFGAVSQCCTVYLNGIPCGVHDGGYTAFSIDITSYLTKKENVLEVEVYSQAEKGEYSYSYQRVTPAGNCHTIQSGIWKTVWLESVPQNYIKNVKTTPLYDQSSVIFQITAAAPLNADIRISENGLLVARGTCDKDGFCKVKLRTFRSWTPEKPFLYDVRICLDEDTIETYFGMRKFSYIKDDKGHLRFALNNEPYFISGISSKGLWSDGLYTPAADQALIADVVNARNMGFNTLRLAGKVEAMRFYYHCDRIGMLVWQDFPYGGQNVSPRYTQKLPCMGLKKLDDTKYRHFGRKSHDGRGAFLSEMNETIQELYSSVCVAIWGIFNEGQGQFDALQMCEKVWAADPT